MKNWNRLAAGDAGCETGGVLFEVAGGESQQVVNYDVNCPAHGVAGKVGVIHGFGENALTGKGGISVNQERKILFAPAFAGAVLLGTRAAYGDGIDGFEVAGV